MSHATVSAALYPDGNFERAIVRNGRTETNGVFVMEGKTNGEFSYTLAKDGYYNTREQKFLFKVPSAAVSNGCWQPYGATNTVVLKRKVIPVAMCVKANRDGIVPPVKNEYIGSDLKKGDWVKPYGCGTVADLNLKYDYEAGKVPSLHYRGAIFLSFTNKHDGAYVMSREASSSFQAVYDADTHAVYLQDYAFVYDRPLGDNQGEFQVPGIQLSCSPDPK